MLPVPLSTFKSLSPTITVYMIFFVFFNFNGVHQELKEYQEYFNPLQPSFDKGNIIDV